MIAKGKLRNCTTEDEITMLFQLHSQTFHSILKARDLFLQCFVSLMCYFAVIWIMCCSSSADMNFSFSFGSCFIPNHLY